MLQSLRVIESQQEEDSANAEQRTRVQAKRQEQLQCALLSCQATVTLLTSERDELRRRIPHEVRLLQEFLQEYVTKCLSDVVSYEGMRVNEGLCSCVFIFVGRCLQRRRRQWLLNTYWKCLR